MEYLLVWSENQDRAYGRYSDFKSKQDFINQLLKEIKGYDLGKYCIKKIELKTCIKTNDKIPSDIIIPLDESSIDIVDYYVVDIV